MSGGSYSYVYCRVEKTKDELMKEFKYLNDDE